MLRALAGLCAVLAAAPATSSETFVFYLTDGSVIVGKPQTKSLTVKDGGDSATFLFGQLEGIAIDEVKATLRVRDRGTTEGKLVQKTIAVQTGFGKVSIPTSLITRAAPQAMLPQPERPQTLRPPPAAAPARTAPTEISCAQISEVSTVGQTTGGSVWIFRVGRGLDDALLVVSATRDANGKSDIDAARERVQSCAGSSRTLYIDAATWQPETHTTLGTFNGWTVWANALTSQRVTKP